VNVPCSDRTEVGDRWRVILALGESDGRPAVLGVYGLLGSRGRDGVTERFRNGVDVGRPNPMILIRKGDDVFIASGLDRATGDTERRSTLAPGTGVTGLI